MNAGGETADQVVRMSLQGIEVAANVVLKNGALASKSLAATLYAILTDKKKVKGKTRLASMLKSGKELKVFAIRHEDLKTFCDEAKRYGVLYCVLKEKNNTDGICDIMVRAEDASKISRIVDKFELATVDTKAIRESVMAQESMREDPFKDIPTMTENEHDDLVRNLMKSMKTEEKSYNQNPTSARTSKKGEHQFEQNLETHTSHTNIEKTNEKRPSVRKELEDIKREKETKRQNSKTKGHQHKVPNRKRKKKTKKRKVR